MCEKGYFFVCIMSSDETSGEAFGSAVQLLAGRFSCGLPTRDVAYP